MGGIDHTNFTILINIQLLVEVVSRWKRGGANGRYDWGFCLASSQSTFTVAQTTPILVDKQWIHTQWHSRELNIDVPLSGSSILSFILSIPYSSASGYFIKTLYSAKTARFRIAGRECVSSAIRSRDRSRPKSGVTMCERPFKATATSRGLDEVRSFIR